MLLDSVSQVPLPPAAPLLLFATFIVVFVLSLYVGPLISLCNISPLCVRTARLFAENNATGLQ